MSDSKPVLWQIEISHYSEKARWALEYKGVDHVRRAPLPGTHIPIALWLSRGASVTLPILQLDGRTIADSTEIIAALERRHPEPALYPEDPELRRRALALEDYFDEELGPYARRLAFHELVKEPEVFAELASETVPAPLARMKTVTGLYASAFASVRWGAQSEEGGAEARTKILAAMDRLEAELEANGGEYLVGDGFTVADLTAASLFIPVVGPAEAPIPRDRPSPPAFAAFRESLSDRDGFQWVDETFRRHRHRTATPVAVSASRD